MPYIKQEDRSLVNPLSARDADTAGELNYQITKLCDRFIRRNGVTYSNLNLVIGALECAKLELYRRVLTPYEECKLNENGDVYGR